MNKLIVLGTLGWLLTALLAGTAHAQSPSASSVPKPQGFALLELFTSEGCSSCPPADDLLKDLITKREGGGNFFALAFHVDYWNYIGWNDRFSDASYTARQQKYADAFKLDAMYTPQIIVNGKEQTVGNDDAKIGAFIDKAMSKTPSLAFESLAASIDAKNEISASYKITGAIKPHTVVNIALVEKGLSSDVAKGENAGRKLFHENVVRVFKTLEVSDSKTGGTVTLSPPADAQLKNCEVIAYLQDGGSMAVLGAARAVLK